MTEAARAFVEFSNTENFEERLLDGNRIDGEVPAFMLKMAAE